MFINCDSRFLTSASVFSLINSVFDSSWHIFTLFVFILSSWFLSSMSHKFFAMTSAGVVQFLNFSPYCFLMPFTLAWRRKPRRSEDDRGSLFCDKVRSPWVTIHFFLQLYKVHGLWLSLRRIISFLCRYWGRLLF